MNKIHSLDYYPVNSILIFLYSEQESTNSTCLLKILLFCSKDLKFSESRHVVTANNYSGGAKCLNKKQEGTKHNMNLYCSTRNEQQYTRTRQGLRPGECRARGYTAESSRINILRCFKCHTLSKHCKTIIS